jgi:esterase
MELHFQEIGEGQPFIILHGLFGSGDNWLSIAKELSTDYRIYLPDLRNHGRSPWSEEFTYEAMSNDIREFIKDQHINQPIIAGHSMGGKVAMHFAVQHPDALRKLIVADIGPKYYRPHHQKILEGLRSIDLSPLQSRQHADTQLAEYIPELGVRQFLLKSLYRTDEPDQPTAFAWRINLPVIDKKIENVGEALVFNHPVNVPALFIHGEKSNYVKQEDIPLIQQIFPKATLETVANAGHWLHAEQPQAFLEKVKTFLKE